MRINKKNFYKRKLDKSLPHFTKTSVSGFDVDPDNINKWIYENCAGRYSIADNVLITNDDVVKQIVEIGFEEPADMTLFALSGLMNNA